MKRFLRWLTWEHEFTLGDVYADLDGGIVGHGILIAWQMPGFVRRLAQRIINHYWPENTERFGRDDISDLLLGSLYGVPEDRLDGS